MPSAMDLNTEPFPAVQQMTQPLSANLSLCTPGAYRPSSNHFRLCSKGNNHRPPPGIPRRAIRTCTSDAGTVYGLAENGARRVCVHLTSAPNYIDGRAYDQFRLIRKWLGPAYGYEFGYGAVSGSSANGAAIVCQSVPMHPARACRLRSNHFRLCRKRCSSRFRLQFVSPLYPEAGRPATIYGRAGNARVTAVSLAVSECFQRTSPAGTKFSESDLLFFETRRPSAMHRDLAFGLYITLVGTLILVPTCVKRPPAEAGSIIDHIASGDRQR